MELIQEQMERENVDLDSKNKKTLKNLSFPNELYHRKINSRLNKLDVVTEVRIIQTNDVAVVELHSIKIQNSAALLMVVKIFEFIAVMMNQLVINVQNLTASWLKNTDTTAMATDQHTKTHAHNKMTHNNL